MKISGARHQQFFLGKSQLIFSPIFTNDYYQVCLIKSVSIKDFSQLLFQNRHFLIIFE